MKQIIHRLIVILTLWASLIACSNFLSETPVGELTEEQIQKNANLEGLVISAYAVLDGQFDETSSGFNSASSNWQFADVPSDDVYKGGGGTGDQGQIHRIEIFTADASITDVNRKWLALFEGIKRCNIAITHLAKSEYSQKTIRIAEMKFLRAHYYFTLKIIYNKVPYIDEHIAITAYPKITNTALTQEQLWNKITADFISASADLPNEQKEIGRPNKWTAYAYLAKSYLYQQKWKACSDACDTVIKSGKYALQPNFRDVFLPENDNSSEIVFCVQASINDGSPNNYNGNAGDRLLPPGGPYPNYGFMRPSQNLVNAYQTNNEGLPEDNNLDVTDSAYVDVRLDHTIARPGLMFLDVQLYNWTPREVGVYGPYSPKKRLVSKNSPHYLQIWPYANALNVYLIRYADVLLWRAEAAIEQADLGTAFTYINQVRKRAGNSKPVMKPDGITPAAKYNTQEYKMAFGSKEEALKALRTERRLEFALEGVRFFDLVRWDIAANTINTYLSKEKLFRSHLQNAHFKKGVHEYFPIPQAVIDLSEAGVLIQNPGYN